MNTPAKPRWLDWLPLVGMAITVIGLIWSGATYVSQIQDNTRRITAIEQDAQKRSDTLQAVDARTARIEGMLEAMRDQKK